MFVSYNIVCNVVLTATWSTIIIVLQDNTLYAQLHFLACVFIPLAWVVYQFSALSSQCGQ